MTTLYAQPYNISAQGFFFESAEDYDRKASGLKDDFCQPVEEFEIQFIDGERIDVDLAKAWGLSQCNLRDFFRVVEDWSDDDKTRFIVAVGECGYGFDPASISPNDFDVDVYAERSLRDLAIEFVEEGLFGEIPKHLEFYIDYDAIARDLAADYSVAEIGGQTLIYRCG